MAFKDWMRGIFSSSEEPVPPGDLRNPSRPADPKAAAPPPPNAAPSDGLQEKRLAAYVSCYQHHALREAAFQMHPELLKGLNSGDRHQLEFGLRHAWFKVPLILGVETSLAKAKEYFATIAHERHHIGDFTVHFLTMPKPERSTEAALIAIAWRDGEPPAYPHHSRSTRYFTLEMMKDQSFTFCEWKQEKHFNYGHADGGLAVFIKRVTEELTGAGSAPVATYDKSHGVQLGQAATGPTPHNEAAGTPQTSIAAAMDEYQKASDAKSQAILNWLEPRLRENRELAHVLDSIVLKFVQGRFGPAGQQVLANMAQHLKRFPSDPLLRQLLVREIFLRHQIGLPIAELKRDIEQKIPEWKPFMEAGEHSEVLEKYLELLSLMEEKKMKLELAKITYPAQGNA